MTDARSDAADTAATQTLGTEGIKPLGRLRPLVRVFMHVVAFAERLNLRYSKVGNPAVYDNAQFPWAAELERASPAIRAELARVLERQEELPGFHEIAADVATISQDRRWKAFLLVGYGLRSEHNIRRCLRPPTAVPITACCACISG
jgi:beta-hydroxylase